MSKTVVIRNPTSGRGKLARSWPDVESRLRNNLGDLAVWNTTGPGHATVLAQKAVSEGYETIIAAGGDGTVTQTANGLIGSGVTFGVFPSGTGNDLCRTLGIGASVEKAMDALAAGKTQMMDVCKWTTDQSEGYFLNIAGIGFDAAVAERINHGFKTLRGTLAYLAATVTTLQKYRATELKLTIDGNAIEEKVMLAAVANAQFYGGGMKVAPMASITDGLLDVVLVKEIGRIEFLRAFPFVFKGGHMGHPAVDHYRARSIRLEPKAESPFLIDGEIVPCHWVEIEVVPGALRIIVP